MQLMNGFRMVYHARVVVVHAVDVCPYLDFLGVDGSAHERGGVVRTTTVQVVDLTVSIAADEALGDIYLSPLIVSEQSVQLLTDVGGVWLRVLVSAHEVECVQQYHVDALLFHVVGHHVGRQHLSLCHDALLLETGEELLGE